MKLSTNNSKENKSQSIVDNVSQKDTSKKSTAEFVDNRPQAIAQRKLQEKGNNHPRMLQLKAIQEMADKNSLGKHGHPLIIQRVKYNKRKNKSDIEAAIERLESYTEEDFDEIKICFEWAKTKDDFEYFTHNEEHYDMYIIVRDELKLTADILFEESSEDTSNYFRTIMELMAVKTQKPIETESAPSSSKPPESKSKPKRSEMVLDFGAPIEPRSVRPSLAMNLPELLAIDGDKYPSTLASSFLNLLPILGGSINVGELKKLRFGGTYEVKVTYKGKSIVVHYHPGVEVEGVSEGESNMHVKGSRSVKHHENLSEAAYADLGVPTLSEVEAIAETE